MADTEEPDVADVSTAEAPARDTEGKALDTLTDHIEDTGAVVTNAGDAIARLLSMEEDRARALQKREKALLSVKLDPADVDLVASELQLERKESERLLQQHGGNVEHALRTFVK